MGIQTTIDEIVTSAQFTASYLKQNSEKYGNIYMIGESQLEKELQAVGVPMSDINPDTILVSFDTTLNYEKLMVAFHALKNVAHFIVTDPDFVCIIADGGLVDAGAIIS